MGTLLTVPRAAERLGLPDVAMWTLLLGGQIPVVKLGMAVRIRPEDLDEYINANTKRFVPDQEVADA